MSVRQYQNPPVHEVVLQLQFLEQLEESQLQALLKHMREHDEFGDVSPLSRSEMLMGLRPGEGFHQSTHRFAGWLFKSDPPDWILQTRTDLFSLHAVRPGSWPHGPYVGWSTILSKLKETHESLRQFYQQLKTKRLGLRYLNRIALPEEADVAEWLRLRIQAPGLLRNPYSFQLNQTWASAAEEPDISATLRLAKIAIEDSNLAEGNQGVLLDIDVFNLHVRDAPDYDSAIEWFSRAHEVENGLFEGCITDQLRQTFQEVAYANSAD